MRWLAGILARLAILAASLWAYLEFEQHRWANPSDTTARWAFGNMLGVELPADVPVIAAQRSGFIDYKGCAVFEMTASLDPILGPGAGLGLPTRDMLMGCPDGFDAEQNTQWTEYALPSYAHLEADEIVALYRSNDDRFVKVIFVVH